MQSARLHSALTWMACDLAEEMGDSSAFPERQTNRPRAPEPAVDAAARAIPNAPEQGVFWSEPEVQRGLRKRSLFDKEDNLLSVISAFDHSPP